jgi:uncharacterized protein YwgA
MKIVFLLLKEAALEPDVKQTSTFKPYKFGPFDPEVFDAIEALKELGIVEESANQAEKDISAESDEPYDVDTVYRLTPLGIAKVERIVRQMPLELLKKIGNYKQIYGSKPLVEILHYVYGKFPKYAELSEANI